MIESTRLTLGLVVFQLAKWMISLSVVIGGPVFFAMVLDASRKHSTKEFYKRVREDLCH